MRASRLPLAWLRFLIWSLALALPIQGMAAVRMLACAPQSAPAAMLADSDMHHVAQMQVHPSASLQHADHHHGGLQHTGHAMENTADGHGMNHASSGSPHGSPHGSAHQCSACASCCVGAMLMGPVWVPAGPSGQAVHRATPEPASLTVTAAALERPPRSTQA